VLPSTDRLLLGPGPSPVSAAVTAALGAPARSHLDADLVALLDGIRTSLTGGFRADADSTTLAISGTGTAAMEAAVANVTGPGTRATVVVTGYFGDRLAQMLARHGAEVSRVESAWGRAADPDALRSALRSHGADIVAMVHGETSTGVLNPVADLAGAARDHGALTIVDAVTSFGAVPLDVSGWGIDICYSCSQKGLGAPSGLSPITFSRAAIDRRVACRSFAFDIGLLQTYWIERKYHHTISAPLVYALAAALSEVDAEGLPARWSRHERHHRQLVAALAGLELSLLPPPAERLWSLNAVQVPAGVDEAAVRSGLLRRHNIEIGAGLGPLAGKVWRIGLMGSGSTADNVERVVQALSDVIGRP
jgi:alanine-glyoxylate transaminase/serine-glyoxylate transaminase/serine-pyruvate transaminase